MTLMMQLIVCGFLVVVIVALFLYQRWLENHSDHYIHLHGEQSSKVVTAQTAQAKRLDTIAKVKNGLIILTIIYVLAMIGIAAYTAWNNTGS